MTEGSYEECAKCILCGSERIAVYSAGLNLKQCLRCGHRFDSPRPAQDSIVTFYSKSGKYHGWEKTLPKLEKQWVRVLSRIRKHEPSGRLLDIGAGIGQFLYLARSFYEVSGTEVSSEACRIARERYGVRLELGDADTIDYPTGSFDIVSMFQVLEHVPYPGGTLDRIRTLLRKGGLAYISVPNEAWYSMRRIVPWFTGKLGVARFRPYAEMGFRKIDLNEVDEVHLSHFTPSVLQRALRERGFAVVAKGCEFADPLLFGGPGAQAARHLAYGFATILERASGMNLYNAFYVVARKR